MKKSRRCWKKKTNKVSSSSSTSTSSTRTLTKSGPVRKTVRSNRIKRGGLWNFYQINKTKDYDTFLTGLTQLDSDKVEYALNKNPSYANQDIDIRGVITKPLLYACSQGNSNKIGNFRQENGYFQEEKIIFRIINILTEKGADIASENKNGEIPASLFIKSNKCEQKVDYHILATCLLNNKIINNDKVWYAIFFPILKTKLLDYLLDSFDKSFNYNLALQFVLKQKPPNLATEAAVTNFEDNINSIATKLLMRPPPLHTQLQRRKGFADVNAATPQPNTPLHFACWFYPEVHEKLINKFVSTYKANVNAQNEQGRTPLHLLLLNLSPQLEQQQQLPEDVRNKIISIAKYLINSGAKTDLTDVKGVSVKSLAQEVNVSNELFRAQQQPQVTPNYLITPPLVPQHKVSPLSNRDLIGVDVMGDKLTLFGECIKQQPQETCIEVENCYANEAIQNNAQDYKTNRDGIKDKIKNNCYQKHLPQHITYGQPTTPPPDTTGQTTQASP